MLQMTARDKLIWRHALPYLDVRSNDEHTLHSYRIALALLRAHPQADEAVVLPAILMHDMGWECVPQDKMLLAFGPKQKYPEIQRLHEVEGARIAREILARPGLEHLNVDEIATIIDGHDTRREALSLNDALVKDADKLWRFTSHGISKITVWFDLDKSGTVDMLRSFVVPSLLTDIGGHMAQAYLAALEGELALTSGLLNPAA